MQTKVLGGTYSSVCGNRAEEQACKITGVILMIRQMVLNIPIWWVSRWAAPDDLEYPTSSAQEETWKVIHGLCSLIVVEWAPQV